MRVCLLMFQGNMFSGGQGIYIDHLSRELIALGHDVHVIAGPPHPKLAPGVHVHPVDGYDHYRFINDRRNFLSSLKTPLELFHPLNFLELATTRFDFFTVMTVYSLRALARFRELHARHPFDVIHDNQSLAIGILGMRSLGVPLVATIHHPLLIDAYNAVARERSFIKQVRRALFYPAFLQTHVARRADRVITVSRASASKTQWAFGVRSDRVRIVPVGVDAEVFRPLGLERERGSILYVGNANDPNKGIQYLLEALAMLRDRIPFTLTFVGERREGHEFVPRLIRQFGLSTRVRFTGRLTTDELVEQYNRHELMVCPSIYEGFGMPVTEAMASGTPVVATTGGALPEVAGREGAAVLVPPRDAPALAKAIETVLEADEATKGRMGQAGRARMLERFTWRGMAEGTGRVYEEVVGAGACR